MASELLFTNESLDVETRVKDLLNRLTLDEKFRLMSGHMIWWTNKIKRLKIPAMGLSDGPRGISWHSSYHRNTQFPAPKAMAATWNRSCTALFGECVAEEVRARKKHVLLAPGINIDRTPLNGRTFEYYSEDPFFIKEMVIPLVKAVQKHKIAVSVKHYAANNQETNRKYVSAEIDERTLREIYTRAFEMIVKESNPWTFMSCYNRVNGVYGSENKTLLWDLLIETFGFTGFVMSDWFAAKPVKDPASSLNAGQSLEMPNAFLFTIPRLQEAFQAGRFTEERLNEVIRRLLRVMVLTGVFDKHVPKGEVNTVKHQQASKQIAIESMTLLKNTGNLLPLNKAEIKKIAVLGANSNKKFGKILYGGSSAVVPPFEITPLQGLKCKLKGSVEFVIDPALADIAIIITGLNHSVGSDSEAGDRTSLSLASDQEQLILETVKKNPKTVVVLMNGSPVAMDPWLDKVPALVEAWYPGMLGGEVIADVLFGDINPSGKLPITFPKSLQDSPAHKSERTYPGVGTKVKENLITDVLRKQNIDRFMDNKVYYDERIYVGYRHFDKEHIEPLFPFGFGLSYTTFELISADLDKATVGVNDIVNVTVQIKNTGKFAGSEVIQIYAKDMEASVDRPPQELCGFEKVRLEVGETKKVVISIKIGDLAFYDVNSHAWKVEPGQFKLLIGNSSRNVKYAKDLQVK